MGYKIRDGARHQWKWAIDLAKKGEPMELIKTLNGDVELDAESRGLLAKYIASTPRAKKDGRPKALTPDQEQWARLAFATLTNDWRDDEEHGGRLYRKKPKGVVRDLIAHALGVRPATIEKLTSKRSR